MKMCLVVLKVEKKNRMEVHVYAHDRCQANLSMGWLVCACITIFHEVITIFFFGSTLQAKYSLVDVSWHRVVHTNASNCNTLKKKKGRKNIAIRTSTTAAKVVIFD